MSTQDGSVRKTLLTFLKGAPAHASLDDAVKNFPAAHYGKKPKGAPHTAWQELEHIRITLRDLVDFSTNPKYRPLKWPKEYWPAHDAPASPEDWNASIKAVQKDLRAFEKMLNGADVDIYAKIPWGDGQTIFHEILLAIDHTAYHVGQVVMLRKQLGEWKGQ